MRSVFFIDRFYNDFLGEKEFSFFFSLFVNFFLFFMNSSEAILPKKKKKKESRKFLHCIALDKCWIVKRGDKISYWHKLKSFVPLWGNLLVLLRQEIDRITSLLAFLIIRTTRNCVLVLFFAMISNYYDMYMTFQCFLGWSKSSFCYLFSICFGCHNFKNTCLFFRFLF